MPRNNPVYTFSLAAACGLFLFVFGDATASAQTVISSPASTIQNSTVGVVCPKCGRIHSASPSSLTTSSVAPTSYVAPASYAAPAKVAYASNAPSRSAGGTQNVLAVLNSQRSRQGLSSLRYDGSLQAVAERRVQLMASRGLKTHPPGSFAPGRYEGVGWSSSYSPNGVYACYTSDPNMTVAGAAMARGRDGVYFAVVYR